MGKSREGARESEKMNLGKPTSRSYQSQSHALAAQVDRQSHGSLEPMRLIVPGLERSSWQ